MKHPDNLLHKALEQDIDHAFPRDFTLRVMQRIEVDEARRERRESRWLLASALVGSALLLGGGIWMLLVKTELLRNLPALFPRDAIGLQTLIPTDAIDFLRPDATDLQALFPADAMSSSQAALYFLLAAVFLLLCGIDFYLRRRIGRLRSDSDMGPA